MFDEASGVEVYVENHDTKQRYQEYSIPPASPLYTGRPRERYIQAVTGARFSTVVLLHPQFDFKGHTHVEVCHAVDGGVVEGFSYVRCPRTKGSRRKPLEDRMETKCDFTKNKDFALTFAEVVRGEQSIFEPVDIRAVDTFSADENVDLSTDEEDAQRSQRGIIKFFIQRGRARRRKWKATDEDRPITTLPLATSKKVAIDLGKSHSLK